MNSKTIFLTVFLILILNLFFIEADNLNSEFGPKLEKEYYTLSRSKINRVISQGEVFKDSFDINNLKDDKISVSFSADDSLSEIIEFDSLGVLVSPKNFTQVNFLIKGKEIGNFSGNIKLSGDIQEFLPVNISIIDNTGNIPLILGIELQKKSFILDSFIDFKVIINKLKSEEIKNVSITYSIIDINNKTIELGKENRDIFNSFQNVKKFDIPSGLSEGPYILEISLAAEDRQFVNRNTFLLKTAFFKILVFGLIPMWLFLTLFGLLLFGIILFIIIRYRIQKGKKYQMKLDLKSLPKKSPDHFFLGKIAETNIPCYLEPNRLSTHTIVAGATGGGKSIAAQVIIEEALIHNIAILVFDPTAQWSGMLRKCEDKKMLSYYHNFWLKESDARAFKGNVRQIKNAREYIDIKKYMTPGQIQIFSLNKLDPKDMDVFIASVIRQVFKSDPKESPDLKILLVFDEVHRLLAKFGGSGEGFLQVERACREFRKWGIGVMLVSQILSDFVGEIKANISTEMQMRTRDEGDLKRIETKYGGDFLKSLVKASVGVGMFVNPTYNHAKPYFINFRPILHNTRRLPDEELDRYNKYNDFVDDIEYQIEQLEKEKVDTFDLKMEVKLVKDKIMTGSFSVVEIYLEGLKPRISKEWNRLGKQPKKRELELVSEEEIKKSIEEAKKERQKIEKDEEKKALDESSKNKVEVKENIDIKEVAPLTFDNGIMVSSLKELKSVLPNMDIEIFSGHVNDKKNDIAEWFKKNFSKEFGEKISLILDKKLLINEINNYGKEKPEEKKSDEKQPENKPQDKPQDKPLIDEKKS